MSRAFIYEPLYDFQRLFDGMCGQSSSPTARRPARSKRRRDDLSDSESDVDGPKPKRIFRPRMDLHEDAEKNLVTVMFDLPGVNKADVQLELTHNAQLTVTAEARMHAPAHCPNKKDQRDGYVVNERRAGTYKRTLNIASGVTEKDIQASMENSVLTLAFPRTSPEQLPKRISVS